MRLPDVQASIRPLLGLTRTPWWLQAMLLGAFVLAAPPRAQAIAAPWRRYRAILPSYVFVAGGGVAAMALWLQLPMHHWAFAPVWLAMTALPDRDPARGSAHPARLHHFHTPLEPASRPAGVVASGNHRGLALAASPAGYGRDQALAPAGPGRNLGRCLVRQRRRRLAAGASFHSMAGDRARRLSTHGPALVWHGRRGD
jgi:hypothetical protein